MKPIYIVVLLCSILGFKAVAHDTASVQLKDLPTYVGRKVKLTLRVLDFEARKEYIYLYIGNRYPHQELTVIVQRNNGKKHIRLNNDNILGRRIASFTGFVAPYDGEPDTTKNYDDAAIKKEFEREQPIEVYALHLYGTMHREYKPRTGPIDLNGKLAMLITQQKQIGPMIHEPDTSPVDYHFPAMIKK